MKIIQAFIISLVFCIAFQFRLCAQETVPKAAGNWSGSLDLPGMKLELIFKINFPKAGKPTAFMDVPVQGARDLPVNQITATNDSLLLEVEIVHGSFAGEYVNDSTIEGQWKQVGKSYYLTLSKTEKIKELKRPQTPKEPFPYLSENIEYINPKSGLKLAGTLTIPKNKKNSPAVVLISGSGAQDRNETIFEHKPFWVIADYLTRNGIAVLRVDDRGVGGSEGDIVEATSEDFATDVISAIDILVKRREIDKTKIGLIGHSEGGLIAPMAANQSKNVSFIILLAGPGVVGKKILYEQGELLNKEAGMSTEQIQQNKSLQNAIFDILLNEKDSVKQVDRLQRTYSNGMYLVLNEEQKNAINAAIKGINTPWFKHFLTYDPYLALTKIKCPVLALAGEKDLQVPAKQNLGAIQKALTGGGNTNFKTMEMSGLNHLFQPCKTGAVAEYSAIEETISPEVLQLIKEWIWNISIKN